MRNDGVPGTLHDVTSTCVTIGITPVPNDGYGYGYGIVNVAKAVNASAYPVPASSPDLPYARYLAWLKSSDGQSWAKANGVTVQSSSVSSGSGSSARATPSATAKSSSGGSAALIIVVVLVVLVVLAGIALVSRRNRLASGCSRRMVFLGRSIVLTVRSAVADSPCPSM
jgi:hypothetical protein